ncbi:MAG TPA: hypothetical protein DD383_06235 [Rikenellaceae bacterium]|nr:hypothetical protein [Rikenellaceae bacterium]HCQ71829.1 hypothetical protein [Rikenellaceae bacterium]
MKETFKRIWFPMAVVCVIALQAIGMGNRLPAGDPGYGYVLATRPLQPDTIHYRNQFIGNASGNGKEDTSFFLSPIDTTPQITARDTIFPPDSLKDTDPFRFKYYVALFDSLTHRIVVDSLREAGDTIDWPKVDSIYYRDSAIRKKAEFDAWYAGLSKTERKKYDFTVKEKIKKHLADSILNVKDSVKAYRDSVKEATPRILETFALPDSLQYKRIIQWTHEREFHKMDVSEPDTNYNYWFHDYPFYRKDVNATWLGVAGSALQYYNWFNRSSENGVSFYNPYEAWTYSAKTLPMYNTKTPYTELAYFGTLFANSQKASDNLHILTTQNIFPEFNFTLEYDRFGGNGIMQGEKTINKTFVASANYLGKRYLMHAGYIHNKVSRNDNGGTSDNSMVRDTTLDAREYPVNLSNASTSVVRNTFFLDQQYRIPFTFLRDIKYRKIDKAFKDSIIALGDSARIDSLNIYLARREAEREAADTLGDDKITTAFIGHSSEFSVFRKSYQDQITDEAERKFYNDIFNYNPTTSYDSVGVKKLENRLFLRLQPWSDDAIVSKLNGGIGHRLLSYSTFDPTFLKGTTNTVWNSAFVYAGVEGQLKDFIHWDATGDYVFLGNQRNDLSVKANAKFEVFPFRRERKSPVSLDLHFETKLEEPEYYFQHYYSNHFKWDNEFGKISTTKLQAGLSVPRWRIKARVGYALLSGNVYYDSTGFVHQNNSPMSVLSASLNKDFVLGPLHLDNRILFQISSNQDVLPLPTLAANSRLYLQFNVKKNIMQMQLGAEGWYNTKYYSPAWNPAVGAFYNQKKEKYNNGPVIDAFVNVQWKRACIFIKVENVGNGWPMDKADYFSAHNYIRTQMAFKIGIYWPFYLQSGANKAVNASSGLSSGSGGSSGGGFGGLGGFGGGGGGFSKSSY